MDRSQIINLRIGFGEQPVVKMKSIDDYIAFLLDNPVQVRRPNFIEEDMAVFSYRSNKKNLSAEDKKAGEKADRVRFRKLQFWWLDLMYNTQNPLQEKMVLFWHNHFVSSFQKVQESSFIYKQNELFRTHAFGNFKELTRSILYDNAMLVYLDNTQNKVGKPNENLSRELLELFTLGIGNYSEADVKEGARALAGLKESEGGGQYKSKHTDYETKTYLGISGKLNADNMVDAIFKHPKVGHRITEKLLCYFVTDDPDPKMIDRYATYFKNNNFEIKPLLKKIFNDVDFEKINGAKIKDPLLFLFQSFHEVGFAEIPKKPSLEFLKSQGMEIMNPPNVKGWDGGRAWLDSGKLVARNAAINRLFSVRFIVNKTQMEMADQKEQEEVQNENNFTVAIAYDKKSTSNIELIKSFSDQLVFAVDLVLQKDMESILKYDFNAASAGAEEGIQRLVSFLMKTPQYQIV